MRLKAMIELLIGLLIMLSVIPASSSDLMMDEAFAAEADRSYEHLEPEVGPISEVYAPPLGVMPIVVLQGSPYEMGYQYGLQAKDYIALVRDAAWASALSVNSSEEVQNTCGVYSRYISSELKDFNFSAFFQGMSDSMNAQGVRFSPLDCIVMLYWGGRQGPRPSDHCTAVAAWGNSTGRGLIAGVNFDYYQVPSNTYQVILAIFPEEGNSCIIPTGAGRTGSNFVMNDKGLVYIMCSGAQQGPGDTGPGITGFLKLPYVGVTCSRVPEAEAFLTNSTRMFGLSHLLVDSAGDAEVIEATRARYAVRQPGDDNETDYIMASNFYMNPEMKPSQKKWDPLEYNPSGYYRYITARKMLLECQGNVSHTTAAGILSSTDWWDGDAWHMDDPWSTNTINRFRPDVASLYSVIVVGAENRVSICTGNPGRPYWGNLAPGQTGTYVNLTVGDGPEKIVFDLKSDAARSMLMTAQLLGKRPEGEAKASWDDALDQYWRGVWWLDRAVIENNSTLKAVAWGRSATAFAKVVAVTGEIQESYQGIHDLA